MNKHARPNAICLDLDDTLVDGSGLREAIRLTCDRLGTMTGVDPARVLEANGEAWQEYWPEVETDWTLGALSGDALSTEVWRRTLVAVGADASLARAARHIHVELALRRIRLFDDAAELLDRLESQVPMAVITNGASDTQRGSLRALGIEDCFAAIVISGEVGVAKPDASAFRLATEALNVEPGAAWHIGDNLVTDVAGALSAGLTAVWLNRSRSEPANDAPAPDLEIHSLSEVVQLVVGHAP